MMGFLKRDFYLLKLNMGFYLAFLAAMSILAMFSDFNASFLFLYAMIFCSSSLIGLFTYDEANRWQAYAAAAPNGRRDQVRGRYAVALLLSVVVSVVLLTATLLGEHPGSWSIALLYGGMLLIYVDVMFPLSYRFGMKSRLIMLIILVVTAGAVGVGSGILTVSGGLNKEMRPFHAAAVLMIICGLIGMVISYCISLAIMKRKEF